jgi:crossover junction endodeoxyribonuclease RuvC
VIYIGIDPGLSGAVAIIEDGWQKTELIHDEVPIKIVDTPTLEVESNGKVRNKYNTSAMAAILQPFFHINACMVILESVHSMPSQGVASSFTFGEGLGMWKGIIAAFGLPLEMVSPQRWKKEMLADQGKDKDASRFKAIQIFPELASQLSRKKDDGRAEALLMAEYGRRLRKAV